MVVRLDASYRAARRTLPRVTRDGTRAARACRSVSRCSAPSFTWGTCGCTAFDARGPRWFPQVRRRSSRRPPYRPTAYVEPSRSSATGIDPQPSASSRLSQRSPCPATTLRMRPVTLSIPEGGHSFSARGTTPHQGKRSRLRLPRPQGRSGPALMCSLVADAEIAAPPPSGGPSSRTGCRRSRAPRRRHRAARRPGPAARHAPHRRPISRAVQRTAPPARTAHRTRPPTRPDRSLPQWAARVQTRRG